MNKKYILTGTLLTALIAGTGLIASQQPTEKKKEPVLLGIRNNTSDKLIVVIKGHPTHGDIANGLMIPKGHRRFVFLGNVSRRGPFIVARHKDLEEHKVSKLTSERFTVAFKLPSTSYIFPVGKLVLLGRGEKAPEYGTFFNSIAFAEVPGGLTLKARRTFPIVPFWQSEWEKLERKELPLSTEGEPILTW